MSVPNVKAVDAEDLLTGFVLLVDLGHNKLLKSRAAHMTIQEVPFLLVSLLGFCVRWLIKQEVVKLKLVVGGQRLRDVFHLLLNLLVEGSCVHNLHLGLECHV